MRAPGLVLILAILLAGCSMPTPCGPGPVTWNDPELYELLPANEHRYGGPNVAWDAPAWLDTVVWEGDGIEIGSQKGQTWVRAPEIPQAHVYDAVTQFMSATTNHSGMEIHEFAMELIASGAQDPDHVGADGSVGRYGLVTFFQDDHAEAFVALGGLSLEPAYSHALGGLQWTFGFDVRHYYAGPGTLRADALGAAEFEVYSGSLNDDRDWDGAELNHTLALTLADLGLGMPTVFEVGESNCP